VTFACQTVHALLGPIFRATPDVIGIDGLNGCRKSALAHQLAGHIHYQVINLDSYLDKNKGTYVDHLDIDSVRDAVQGRKSIVEGVCLLNIIELADLELDLSIYVRRYHLGLWADEDWLGLNQNVDEYLEKLNSITASIAGLEEPEPDMDLSEEIIRYHHYFRPHEKADLTFSWNDS
jgi:hypothetical protein